MKKDFLRIFGITHARAGVDIEFCRKIDLVDNPPPGLVEMHEV